MTPSKAPELKESLPLAITGGRVPTVSTTVYEPRGTVLIGRTDQLAVEEPLEIRVSTAEGTSTISITMQTPGHDSSSWLDSCSRRASLTVRDQIRKIAVLLR